MGFVFLALVSVGLLSIIFGLVLGLCVKFYARQLKKAAEQHAVPEALQSRLVTRS